MKHIIEVYDKWDMKITHYEYDGTESGEMETKAKIARQMQGADYYTVVTSIND